MRNVYGTKSDGSKSLLCRIEAEVRFIYIKIVVEPDLFKVLTSYAYRPHHNPPLLPPPVPIRVFPLVIIYLLSAPNQGICPFIIHAAHLFQLNMVITSILILCVIAMALYQVIQMLEHSYKKRL